MVIRERHASSGFTIVELLIVIVVIGVLAAITSVSFSAVSQRAKVSAAKSEMKSVTQAMQILLLDGEPLDNNTWLKAFGQLGMNTEDQSKIYLTCQNNTTREITIVAYQPIYKGNNVEHGDTLYAYTQGSSREFTYDSAAAGTYYSTRICGIVHPGYTHTSWTYNFII